MNIRWTPRFFKNVQSARKYVFQENPQAAHEIMQRLEKTLELLTRFPEAGKASTQKENTRLMLVQNTPYNISYRIQSDVIELVAFLHHAQKWL